MTRLVFAIPGDIGQATGGYGYDRRVVAELRETGRNVDTLSLPAAYPFPSPQDEAAADAALAALPDQTAVVVDGLAFGAMPAPAARHGERLRLVALVHHPLALETGLDAQAVDRMRQSERAALTHARRIVTTSRYTARLLTSDFGVPATRLVVAEPGTEPAPRAPRAGCPPVILSVGSLTARKGHDVLLSALARIADTDWRCRVVGDGPERAALSEIIGRTGLSDRVVLAGEVADISREMLAADVFALATRFEGYGMAFAEAMAHGLPVVGCEAGAVPDVVGGAGLLVPVDDAAALGEAIAGVLGGRGRADELAARSERRARSLPTWRDSAMRIAMAVDGI